MVVVVLHVGIVVVVVVSSDNITVDAETVVVIVVEIVVVVVVETVVVVVVETAVAIVVDSAGVVVLLTHSSGQPKLVGSSSKNSKQSVGHWFVFSVVVVEFGVSDVEKVVVKVVVDVEEVVVKGVVDVEVFVVNVVGSKQSAGHPSGCWHLHSQLLQISAY